MNKNVTSKYRDMVEAFNADFWFAQEGEHKLIELQSCIDNKNERLMQHIALLDELDYGIRYGKIIIMEVEENDKHDFYDMVNCPQTMPISEEEIVREFMYCLIDKVVNVLIKYKEKEQ